MHLKERLYRFKNYYMDVYDPERVAIKSAFRTAFGCTISMLLFQILGNLSLSVWAGFATFAFIQNDTLEQFVPRLKFLIGIIILFSCLVMLGIYFKGHTLLFLISLPFIIFFVSYLSCLGFCYFTAGAWALFLYILSQASSSAIGILNIGTMFLSCGIISIVVCFFIFPIKPYLKMMLNYERVLIKIDLLLESYSRKIKRKKTYKIILQLDHILALQNKSLSDYLASRDKELTLEQKSAFLSLSTSLYQFCLMIKSFFSQYENIYTLVPFKFAALDKCLPILKIVIHKLINKMKFHGHFDLFSENIALEEFRDNITEVRKKEISRSNSDFSEYMACSNYLYQFIMLLELAKKISKNIGFIEDLYEK